MGLAVYYCTFGNGQPNANKCQPIVAASEMEARAWMFEHYGPRWCTSYDEAAWLRTDPRFREALLPTVIAGQMEMKSEGEEGTQMEK